jgi:GT2 family glycosyltransferase
MLTYNSRDDVLACLKSLSADGTPDKEILLVDNASDDGSVEIARQEFPEIPILQNNDNRGVAGGWNQGWRAARGEFVAFVNPDTTFDPQWLNELLEALRDDPEADAAGCKLLFPDGRLQHAGGRILRNAQTRHFGYGEPDDGRFDELRTVDYVTGAAWLVRRAALEALGGFDEDYFPAYYEELDFCHRLRRAGRKVLYVPTARVIHHESTTLGVASFRFSRLHMKMRSTFVAKRYSLADFFLRFIPGELRLFLFDKSLRIRLAALLSYPSGLRHLIRRLSGGRAPPCFPGACRTDRTDRADRADRAVGDNGPYQNE